MRYAPRALLLGLAVVAVLILTACGSSGSLLSADQGSTLNAQLNSVQAALAKKNCPAAVEAAGNLQNSASSLSGVDPSLSNALTQGASTVLSDVRRQCPVAAPTTPTTATSSTPTTTATTTSTPTVTQTPPTSSTPTTPPPTPTTTTPAPATTPSGTGTTTTGSGGAGIGGGSGNGGSGNGGSGNGAGGGGGY